MSILRYDAEIYERIETVSIIFQISKSIWAQDSECQSAIASLQDISQDQQQDNLDQSLICTQTYTSGTM